MIEVASHNDAVRLADLVGIRSRFLRSINLEADFYSPQALEGYVLTSGGRAALTRLSAGVRESNSRAYCLTGSYGSGKSAFALFAAHLFSPTRFGGEVREKTTLVLPELRSTLNTWKEKGLFPVLIVGGREPVGFALISGLLNALLSPNAPNFPKKTRRIRECRALLETPPISDRETTQLFTEVAKEVSSVEGYIGLLVVVDEMGKFLEHAALHPNEGDLQVFQSLAEAACRSEAHPLWLVTILHQAFEEYAQRLSPTMRREWQKVQGRFEDIAFGDTPEETMRLTSQALERDQQKTETPAFNALMEQLTERSGTLALSPPTFTLSEFGALCREAYPFHPLTLRLLPYVFRRFGQNERTLFAFLSSVEEGAFGQFLQSQKWNPDRPPLFTIDRLYDYLISALGSNLYTHATAKLWSEAADALLRLEDETPLKSRLIKIIGLLHILGEQTRLLPSPSLLKFALEAEGISGAEVEEALKDLTRQTLLVYRQFRGAYRLYEGSDVDVESRLRDAHGLIAQNTDSVEIAQKLGVTPPMVARRHSYKTGTLRIFDVHYCRLENLQSKIYEGCGSADGLLLLCLARDVYEENKAKEIAENLLSNRNEILFGICNEGEALRETAVSINALLWMQAETVELQQDTVARREVNERLSEANRAFQEEWERLLNPYLDSDIQTQWLYLGDTIEITSRRQLQVRLSEIADSAYPFTPILQNELINRRQISSTAAAARRDLMEAMLTRRHLPQLGIENYPPELSMYLSLFGGTGIHRKEGDDWNFFPPDEATHPALSYLWNEIETFLFHGALQVKPLEELYARLQDKPYGLMEGVIPPLLLAVLLCHEEEVALYEDGRFVNEWNDAVFERVMKRPHDFGLRGCRIAGERKHVLERFARGLLRQGEEPTLVNVVKRILREFNKLPEYTIRTKNLTEKTRGVRERIKESKEPDQLLFSDLPVTLVGFPFHEEKEDEKNIEDFFRFWNTSFSELREAYPALLKQIETSLCTQFEVSDCEELRERTSLALSHITEAKLKAFALRASDKGLNPTLWLESVAAGLVGRPPYSWVDADFQRFTSLLPPLAKAFQHSEQLVFEIKKRDAKEDQIGFRLSVTHDTGEEEARVAVIPRHNEKEIYRLAGEAQTLLEKLLEGLSKDIQIAVLALATEELIRGRNHD